ncbi:hypothetical protein HID58_033399, partial [Brassica napus]
ILQDNSPSSLCFSTHPKSISPQSHLDSIASYSNMRKIHCRSGGYGGGGSGRYAGDRLGGSDNRYSGDSDRSSSYGGLCFRRFNRSSGFGRFGSGRSQSSGKSSFGGFGLKDPNRSY